MSDQTDAQTTEEPALRGGQADGCRQEKTTTRALKLGSAMLWLRLVQYVFLFGSSVLVARSLAPAGRAAYILPLNIAGIATVLSNLSLETAAGRLLGRREVDVRELIGPTFGTGLVSAAVGVVAAASIGLAFRHELSPTTTAPQMLLASTVVIPNQLNFLSAGLLLRIGALRSYGAVSAVAALAQLIAVLCFYSFGHLTVSTALLLTVLGFTVMAAGLTGALAYHIGLRTLMPCFTRPVVKALLVAASKIHPGTITAQLNLRLDLVVVSAMSTRHDTGLYSLAMTLSEAAMLASLTVAQSALHIQIRESEGRAARYTTDFARHTFLLACTATVLASALMYPFLDLAYGHAWVDATIPAIVTLMAVAVGTPDGPIRFFLIQAGNPLWTSVVAAVALVANLLGDVALIPVLGIVGASLATLVSNAVLTAIMLRWFTHVTGLRTRGIYAPPHRRDPLVEGVLARARSVRELLPRRG